MVSPDRGECVLAQLHDIATPASFSALSLLHFPVPAFNPLNLPELLQQFPETTVFWAGRVADLGSAGRYLVDLVCGGATRAGNP